MFSFPVSCKSEHKNYYCIDNEIREISEACETTFIQRSFARFRVIIFIQSIHYTYLYRKTKLALHLE